MTLQIDTESEKENEEEKEYIQKQQQLAAAAAAMNDCGSSTSPSILFIVSMVAACGHNDSYSEV